jgi:hypothetical protein
MGCVVVAMRDSGDELEPEHRVCGARLLSGPGWQPAARSGAMRQPWLAGRGGGRLVSPAGVKDDGWCGCRAARLRL